MYKFIFGALVGALLSWLSERYSPLTPALPITTEVEVPQAPPQSRADLLRSYSEHDEAAEMGDSEVPVNLRTIHLGDLTLTCPTCDEQVDEIAVGLGSAEDRMTGQGEFNQLLTMGFIVYSCGDTFFSPCFTDRVASILNAEEAGNLSPSLFENLVVCEEHGDADQD